VQDSGNPANRLHCQHPPSARFESKRAAHQPQLEGGNFRRRITCTYVAYPLSDLVQYVYYVIAMSEVIMAAWLQKKVSVGDILTVFSILIAAFAAITTWRTEIQTRQRSQAEGVRKAAAEVVAKTERRFEISEWIFEDIQPDIVTATTVAAAKDLPPGTYYNPTDPKDDTIRRAHLRAARDFLYKQIAEAHQRERKRQFDEQLETSYTALYGYIPDARRFIQDATYALLRVDSEMILALQSNVEAQNLRFTGDVSETAQLGNCLRWAVDATKHEFDKSSNVILRHVVDALNPIVSASDELILRGLRNPKQFQLDRSITPTALAKADSSASPSPGCAKLVR
jgi:hypothetical protein